MKKNYVLKVSDRKGMFSHSYECCEFGETTVITIRNKASALRKFARKENEGNIILAAGQDSMKIYENKIKEYFNISYEVVITVIEKICRQAAQEFSLQIPFGEIYVVAPIHIACAFINELSGLSRLFTVVSPLPPTGGMYDELYFKNGTIIRHIPSLKGEISKDAIIIGFSGETIVCPANTAVIDLCKKSSDAKSVLGIDDVYIYDEEISDLQMQWGGESGAALYTLCGKIPQKDAVVKINKRTDRIFLLDTEKF